LAVRKRSEAPRTLAVEKRGKYFIFTKLQPHGTAWPS
jgi:hypothetical protein